jgi:linoleate 9S-lipoxygenase
LIDPATESRLALDMSFNIYVPRDERFGHLKLSDFLAYSLKSVAQLLVPELKSLFDSTPNEFDSFEDIMKVYSDGIKLPENGILDAAKNFIPLELIKQFLTTDGQKLLKYPLPQVIDSEYFSSKHTSACSDSFT